MWKYMELILSCSQVRSIDIFMYLCLQLSNLKIKMKNAALFFFFFWDKCCFVCSYCSTFMLFIWSVNGLTQLQNCDWWTILGPRGKTKVSKVTTPLPHNRFGFTYKVTVMTFEQTMRLDSWLSVALFKNLLKILLIFFWEKKKNSNLIR